MTADRLSPAAYGMAYAVNPVTVLDDPAAHPELAHPPPARDRVYAVSILISGIGFGLTYFAHTTIAYGATVFVWTLGEIGFNAIGPTIINTIAPDSMRGRYNGLIGLAFGGASMLAPADRHVGAEPGPGGGLGRLPRGQHAVRGLPCSSSGRR